MFRSTRYTRRIQGSTGNAGTQASLDRDPSNSTPGMLDVRDRRSIHAVAAVPIATSLATEDRDMIIDASAAPIGSPIAIKDALPIARSPS